MESHLKCLVTSLVFIFISAVSYGQTQAEKKTEVYFRKMKIQVGEKNINVELAENPQEHERGLMYRKTLKSDEGMLFIFPDEEIRYFWMKNTFIDLSIGYFDAKKTLIDIQEMKAVTSVMEEKLPTYPSRLAAQFALEMNKGWFKKNKIKIGAKLKLLH